MAVARQKKAMFLKDKNWLITTLFCQQPIWVLACAQFYVTSWAQGG